MPLLASKVIQIILLPLTLDTGGQLLNLSANAFGIARSNCYTLYLRNVEKVSCLCFLDVKREDCRCLWPGECGRVFNNCHLALARKCITIVVCGFWRCREQLPPSTWSNRGASADTVRFASKFLSLISH
ncbi:hypothetical protein AVEN_266240-1 [Araneus ventricosus]|uniref:Kazal-like domain-containing protein n=1 Tax=Araneus ventricosus TaxID=182803 RepID=A0A4Y2R2W5_ARAVE|nr:hypothetical protein AVEN_266240-1 [Araneus ventricosus]